MSFLFNFSQCITVPIVSEWLSSYDFVTLDTSLCNRLDRDHLFSLMKSFPKYFLSCIYPTNEYIPFNSSIFDWAPKRSLKVDGLSVKLTNSTLKAMEPFIKSKKVSKDKSKISKIALEVCKHQYQPLLIDLVTSLPNLLSIDFSWIFDCEKFLKVLTNCCHKLKSIKLGCGRHSSIHALCIINPDLEHLDCCMDTKIALGLIVHCRKLLSVKGFMVQFSEQSNIGAFLLLFHCRTLVNYDALNHCGKMVMDTRINYCSNKLTKLNERMAYWKYSVLHSTHSLINLTELSIDYPLQQYVDSDLIMLPFLPNLKLFHLKSIEKVFSLLDRVCPQSVTDLSIVSCNVTDEELMLILGSFFLMTKLDISQNSMLTDTSVALIGHLPHLVSLRMEFCTGVNNAGVISLVTTCTQLKELRLVGCNKLRKACVAAIAHHLHNIRLLYLPDYALDDAIIESLITNCSKMTHLMVREKYAIKLLSNLPKLETVYCTRLVNLHDMFPHIVLHNVKGYLRKEYSY